MEKNLLSRLAVLLPAMALAGACDQTIGSGSTEEQKPVIPEIPPVAVSVDLENEENHSLTISLDEDENAYSMEVTAGDPYFFTEPLEEDVTEGCTVFAFEYKSSSDLNNVMLFFIDAEDGINAAHSVTGGAVTATEEWAPYSIRIKKQMQEFDWGKAGDYLRVDPGDPGVIGNKLQFRNIVIRQNNEAEQAEEDKENEAEQDKIRYDEGIKEYLGRSYSSGITSVQVTDSEVKVTGSYTGEGTYFLAEIPPFTDIFSTTRIAEEYRHPLSAAAFTETFSRTSQSGESGYDRLLSKWAIYKAGEDKDELVSSAMYASDITSSKNNGLPRINPANKKGLGGIVSESRLETDINTLNLTSATINILSGQLMSINPLGDGIEHEYCGKTYYFNRSYVESSLDPVLSTAASHGISVAAILLINTAAANIDAETGALMQHPDFTNGVFTMPDMTTLEATNAYAAMIDFLASRYSAQDKRISHWIIHNEVDGGVHWTNMGDGILTATYMDTYVKSMRMVYNISRQYDSNSQVFISLAHGWTEPAGGGWYNVVDLLDLLNGYSRAEGDFYWAPAYHSYSGKLADPRIWEDEDATFSMDTKYVTMKNLEVIDKWVQDPQNKYKRTEMRKVWLSEAGVGSGTPAEGYSEQELSDQAAGFAYSWKKINSLDGIEGIQWHNWFDNPDEGVLLGLRKYKTAYNGQEYNGEEKPVYFTYQNAGEDTEEEFFRQYLTTLGISSWDEIFHEVK